MSIEIQWPDGKFYACDDAERLSHEEPTEAMEEYLGNFLAPGMTLAEVECALDQDITVTAYVPMEVTDTQIKIWAESLTENLEEMFRDEHGDPDADHPLCGEADAIMLEAVTKIIRATPAWSCQESGRIDIPGEKVLAFARQEWPEWFNEVAK